MPSSTHTARSWNLFPFFSHSGARNIFNPSEIISKAVNKAGVKIDSPTGAVMGEKPIDASLLDFDDSQTW